MEVYRFWWGRQKQSFPSLERNSIFEIRSPFPGECGRSQGKRRESACVLGDIFIRFSHPKNRYFRKHIM